MPIDPIRATEIAKAAGLSLTDASALANLATDEAQAQELAARFADAGPVDLTTIDDPMARRQAFQDNMRAKAAQLVEIRRHTDHNGSYRPPTAPTEPPQEPTVPPPPNPAALQPGGQTHQVGPAPLTDQIAAAEAAGDQATAGRLKIELLEEQRAKMNGAGQ